MSVDFSVQENIATVVLNRPEAMNALDPDTARRLEECWADVRRREDIRVVVITGAGDRAFCAGIDLKKTMPPSESFAQQTFGAEKPGNRALTTEKPVIAAINGVALGGGLELAMQCDIRIAAEGAQLGLTEARVGTIPGNGGTQRLPRIVGLSNALMMMLTGEMIDAQEAYRIGLVNQVVPFDKLSDHCYSIAKKIASNAPLAVRAIKRLAYHGIDLPLDSALQTEYLALGVLRDTKDRIEGRRAFAEKRKPVFRGE